jgi:hypothetical protein
MASLTCINHPDLRWSCKDLAVSEGKYNGARHIFYRGSVQYDASGEAKRFGDNSGLDCERGAPECPCPVSDLVLSPEHTSLTSS